ncbi:MAG: hypothetical protein AAF845_08300 [Bacteroidota bacterium]
MTRLAAFGVALLLAGCGSDLARPADRDVDARVAEATDRLGGSEAGQRVLAAIDAHGGLAAWYGGGPLRFRYTYTRLDSLGQPTSAIDTRQLVDPWASRAVHTLADDEAVSFGWTGTEAWVKPEGAELPTNARFWSLTPYYFVGIPFVLADPGVQHAMASADSVEGQPVDVVRITFEPGTGDAPDDYYDLLLDPETDRVRGVRYVVSYAAFNPDGGHTPETRMLYDGAQTVGAMTLQEGFRSFDSASGRPKARGTVTEAAFAPETPASAFGVPEGAAVLDGL